MRVRSFRNTVLFFSILRLQRYCKAAGKQREGASLGGGGTGLTGGGSLYALQSAFSPLRMMVSRYCSI